MSDAENGEEFTFPVKWEIPDDVPEGYATTLVVQHTEHEFLLYFFRVDPPFAFGTPDQIREKLIATESVDAKCIAKITVAASRMPDFVQVLQGNLEKFKAKLGLLDDESGHSTD